MKRTFVLLASVAVSACAFAQDTPPPNASPTASPMTHPADAGRGPDSRHGTTARGANDFDSLDRQGRGYVTREEVSGDSWLTKNFTVCDRDGDGQITRGEYDGCPGRQ